MGGDGLACSLRATNREPHQASTLGELLTLLMRIFERLYCCTSTLRMRILQLWKLAESAGRIRSLQSTFMKRDTGSTATWTQVTSRRQRWLRENDHSRF